MMDRKRNGARKDAAPIALINGDKFTGLLVEYDIGVNKRSHDIVKISSEAALPEGTDP